jgi:hypothetical protein
VLVQKNETVIGPTLLRVGHASNAALDAGCKPRRDTAASAVAAERAVAAREHASNAALDAGSHCLPRRRLLQTRRGLLPGGCCRARC